MNHETSQAIVKDAREQGATTLVLERLTHSRQRIEAGKRVRARRRRWAWHELQRFIAYQAEAAGIRVIYANPAYSSKTCSACGCLGIRKKHRFFCVRCGYLAHSDRNAAVNLAKLAEPIDSARADVAQPNVAV